MVTPYPLGLWFEQTWMYSIWECFHTSSTFPTMMFFEMKIFEKYQQIQEFFIISYYRWLWPSFKLTWIPFIQWCFLSSLVGIGQVVLENVKMWKVYDNAYTKHWRRRQQGQTADKILVRKSHLSLWRMWAKKVYIYIKLDTCMTLFIKLS